MKKYREEKTNDATCSDINSHRSVNWTSFVVYSEAKTHSRILLSRFSIRLGDIWPYGMGLSSPLSHFHICSLSKELSSCSGAGGCRCTEIGFYTAFFLSATKAPRCFARARASNCTSVKLMTLQHIKYT